MIENFKTLMSLPLDYLLIFLGLIFSIGFVTGGLIGVAEATGKELRYKIIYGIIGTFLMGLVFIIGILIGA